MKSLGAVTTKEELLALIAKHDLEYVDTRVSKTLGTVEATFVHYISGAKSGKFHQYASVEVPNQVWAVAGIV